MTDEEFASDLVAALDELEVGGELKRWPLLPDGREPCAPCRGWAEYCGYLGCSGAVLDELLWALFGWLWLAGGRSEVETWTPDETRIAGVDEDELISCGWDSATGSIWWCPVGCSGPIVGGICTVCGFEVAA